MSQTIITRNPKEFRERLWAWKDKGKFCNTTVSINDQKIRVHAVVLASFIRFFENEFGNTERSSEEVKITDVDTNVMQSLIECCYRGSFYVNEKNALILSRTASILKMSTLVDNCTDFLKKIMKYENCISIWKMANNFNNDAVINQTVPFIKEHINEIYQSDDYLSLDYSELNQILSFKTNMESEREMFNALKQWIKRDISRTKHSNKLLDYFKLECLPKDSISSIADSICGSDFECYRKFLNVASLQKSEYSSNCSSLNTLVIMGGDSVEHSKIVEIFDLKLQRWAKINYPRCSKYAYAIALIDEKILCIGGSSNKIALKTVEQYDLKTGRLESLQDLKYPRVYMPAVTYANNVYVFGGYDYTKTRLSSVEKWSPQTRTWKEVTKMDVARSGTAAAISEDEIFVVGGYNYYDGYLTLTEVYNPIHDTWRRAKDLNIKREYLGLAAVNGFIYAVGGYNPVNLNSVEKYDINIDRWTEVQSLNTPRRGMAAGYLNEQLIITGGYDDSDIFSAVEAYDEKKNKWTSIAGLNQKRNYHWMMQVPWSLAKLALKRKS